METASAVVAIGTMTCNQLSDYGSWASIIGLVVSIIALVYVRSIKTNIIKFRRKQRIRGLIEDISRIPDDALPLAPASLQKLSALKRNTPTNWFSSFTEKGMAALELHKNIDAGNIVAIKEALNDWSSFSGEI